jgi:hypothetical protein
MNDLGAWQACTRHLKYTWKRCIRIMSEEYDYDFIQASLKTQEDPENIFKSHDPFGKDLV